MKKQRKIIPCLTALFIIIATSMPVLAASDVKIDIPTNQVWTYGRSASRTGSFYDVTARCHSVYPKSGEDKYRYIQVRVKNAASGGSVISENAYVKLDEQASGNTSIQLKNGTGNIKTVYFQFRGNTNDGAEAVVSYSGR